MTLSHAKSYLTPSKRREMPELPFRKKSRSFAIGVCPIEELHVQIPFPPQFFLYLEREEREALKTGDTILFSSMETLYRIGYQSGFFRVKKKKERKRKRKKKEKNTQERERERERERDSGMEKHPETDMKVAINRAWRIQGGIINGRWNCRAGNWVRTADSFAERYAPGENLKGCRRFPSPWEHKGEIHTLYWISELILSVEWESKRHDVVGRVFIVKRCLIRP